MAYETQIRDIVKITKNEHVNGEFSVLLNQCVLHGMKRLLGEAGTQDLLLHLQLLQCVQSPKGFHDSLRSVLNSGARVLERMIVEELFQRLDIPYQEARVFDFERCVRQARAIWIVGMKKTD